MSIQTSNRPILQAAISAAGDPVKVRHPDPTKPTKLSVVVAQIVTLEFLAVAASTYFASMLYHYASFGVLPSPSKYFIEALYIASVFTVVSLGFRHFSLAQTQQLHMLLWSGVGTTGLAFAIFLSTVFLLKVSGDYSRGAFVFQTVGVSIAVCIFRTFSLLWLRSAVSSGSVETRRTVLIGDTASCAKTVEELKAAGIRVVASFALPRTNESDSVCSDGPSCALSPEVRNVADLCRTTLPDDVVILAEHRDFFAASDLAHQLSVLPCDIHIAPLESIRFLTRSQTVDLGKLKTLRLSRRPLSFADLAIKRTFDIVVATTALIILSPLLSIIALTIKMDSRGNVLFRQLRHGYNNKIIRVYKFRSMIVPKSDDCEFVSTKENDERVTAVGRILRRTNIDELPQLLNVLLGEMSIVGPRPHATSHNKLFEDQILPFARRHNVKPGITGWAQVNGCRGPADTVERMQQRVEYDLLYIDNWSFFLDLKIILMTVFSKKSYKNAF